MGELQICHLFVDSIVFKQTFYKVGHFFVNVINVWPQFERASRDAYGAFSKTPEDCCADIVMSVDS